MERIRIIAPNGQIGTVPQDRLDSALQKGAKLASPEATQVQTAESPQPTTVRRIRVVAPNGQAGTVPEDRLQSALQKGATIADPTWGDRGKEFTRGAASGLGGVADLGAKAIAVPAMQGLANTVDSAQYGAVGSGDEGAIYGNLQGVDKQQLQAQADRFSSSNLSEQLRNAEILQTHNLPDWKSKALEAAGGALAELPFWLSGAGAVAKGAEVANLPRTAQAISTFMAGGTKPLATRLGAEAATTAGAAALPVAVDETLGRPDNVAVGLMQDIVASTLGGVTANKLKDTLLIKPIRGIAGLVNTLTTNPQATLKSILEEVKDIPASIKARILSPIGTPDLRKDTVEKAADLEIALTPSQAFDSAAFSMIENNVLKSAFASKLYKTVRQEGGEKLSQRLADIIDEVGPNLAAGDTRTASFHLATSLNAQREAARAEKTRLYNYRDSFIEEAEKLKPSKTVDYVKKVGKEVGVQGNSSGQIELNNLLRTLKDIESMAVGEVDAKMWLNKAKSYKKEPGSTYSGYFNGLANAMEEDAKAQIKNKNFAIAHEAAQDFYKREIAERVHSNTAKALLDGSRPQEAYNMMHDPRNIEQLERILDDKIVVDALKRVKLDNILKESEVIGVDGSLNATNFSKFFNDTKKRPLLEKLLGENYNKIKSNLVPIADGISEGLKNMSNPSGTAIITKDLALVGGLGGVTGMVGGGPAGAASAALTAGGINLLSRLFADQKAINKLIQRAKLKEELKPNSWGIPLPGAGMNMMYLKHGLKAQDKVIEKERKEKGKEDI